MYNESKEGYIKKDEEMKPYFTAAMTKNGKNTEKWAGQMSEKAIKGSIYSRMGKKKK